jgi:NAD(P)-dependent dehydrogenase (short-subunit alcohol dehydrogenase family)
MTAIRLKPIEDQAVVIVGATSGIGRAAAERFAARGARLLVVARSQDDLEIVAEVLRARGAADVRTVAADAADDAAMQGVAATAVEAFGRIDTWAHVAGIDEWSSFLDTTPAEFRRIVEVNLLGAANGLRAALPRLRAAGGGAAIVVSSVEAEVPLPDQAAYAASKHGVDALVRAVRMELESEGWAVAVTQVLPASIDTPLFAKARTRLGTEPRPIPPVYDPSVPADLIVHAAEHPSRELYAGGAGWLMAWMRNVLPRPTERLLSRAGRPIQRSGPPKAAVASDNLVSPVRETAIRGGLGGRSASLTSTVQRWPVPVRLGLVALAAAALATRLRRD